MSDVQSIPMRADTQCRKCTQLFFKGTTMMSSHCVTDGENHEWFSPTFDKDARADALAERLARAEELLTKVRSLKGMGTIAIKKQIKEYFEGAA